MPDQARLAFIGCGGFATASIFPNIAQVPEFNLIATCDVVAEKAERNARAFGALRSYSNAEEMLDKEELDGVFVIGPAPQQYELAPMVLKRGIPVYVEKPSANTSADAKELAELAEANKIWGQCGFMKRFAYVYRITKELQSRDEFGATKLVSVKFGQGPYPQIWGIDSYKRAFLIGQCCHLHDLLRFIGGDVRTVSTVMNEDAAAGRVAYLSLLEFANGAIGQLNLNCWETNPGFTHIQERLEVCGEGCSVHCEDMREVRYIGKSGWSDAVANSGPFSYDYRQARTGAGNSRDVHGYLGEVRNFARHCLGLEDQAADLWDSYEALRIGEAIYDSAHGAGTVNIAPR